eukprot:2767585-Rhodomonas_salina.2
MDGITGKKFLFDFYHARCEHLAAWCTGKEFHSRETQALQKKVSDSCCAGGVFGFIRIGGVIAYILLET